MNSSSSAMHPEGNRALRVSNFKIFAILVVSLIPGVSQLVRNKKLLGISLLAISIFLVVLTYYTVQPDPLNLILNFDSFVKVQLFIFAILALVAISLTETILSVKNLTGISSKVTMSLTSTLLIALIAGAVFIFSWFSFPQAYLLKTSFNDSSVVALEDDSFNGFSYTESDPSESATDFQEPTKDEAPSFPDLSWAKGRLNILLIGGDAGPGRPGLRADSLNVVSIDVDSKKAVIIGIPRNLGNAPLPEGALKDKMPNGFNNIINALYGWGHANKSLVNKTLGKSKDPGASVMTASISEFIGIPIEGWVLVDMGGFIEIIDAFGGVDVYVPKDTRAAGAVADSKHKVKRVFEEGWNRLNGTRALSYSRTRSQDSDYSRMQRQRCVLSSLAAQQSTLDLFIKWPTISKVLQKNVKTNLQPSQVEGLIGLAGFSPKNIKMLSLTPPLVPSFSWSTSEVHALVKNSIDPDLTKDSVKSRTSSVKQSCKTIKR